jgi:hypothetical protein
MSVTLQQVGFIICKQQNILRDSVMKTNIHVWQQFCATWNNLPQDPYLLDGGNYRQRRYSVFSYQSYPQSLSILPSEPHFQTCYYNSIHGGIQRYLKSWHKNSIATPILKEIIAWVVQKIAGKKTTSWRIQAHQFRIVASINEKGKPTPEGIHKDGADYIFIMLIQRHNIRGGINRIYNNQRQCLVETILEDSTDCILLDDTAVYHDVSSIRVIDPKQQGIRDVLVLTFHQID